MLAGMERERRFRREGTGISKKSLSGIITETVNQTRSLGVKLSHLLGAGDVVALNGELGSGKTTFTKGIASGLGVAHPEYVNSPSFVIVKEYKGRLNLYHFDLYRLDRLYDIEYIGVEEYFGGDGVVVIEWAKKLSGLLPMGYLEIDIKIIDEKKRGFSFKAHGKRYADIISRYIKQQA